MNNNNENARAQSNPIKFLLYITIIVLVNLIGLFGLFYRCDITANGVYSISKASRDVIKSLAEPLSVKVFISKNLDSPYTDLSQTVEDLLKEYKNVGNPYFSYELFDVGGSDNETDKKVLDNRQLAQDYGVYPQQIQTMKNDQVSFRRVFKGMALVHGDMIQQIPDIEKQQLEYNITTTIKKMSDRISVLLGIKDKIKIDLFLSSDLYKLGSEIDKIPNNIKDIVDKLNKESYGKLVFEHLDSSVNPAIEKQAEQYDLFYIPSREDQAKKLFISLVILYADKSMKIDILQQTIFGLQLTDMETLKDQIKDAVNSIIDVNEKIAYITDHGTVQFSAPEFALQQDPNAGRLAAAKFKELISESYTIKEVNLKDQEIPSEINCLVIAGPKETFTDWELFRLDQFLMQGKSLAIFYDGLQEIPMPQEQQYYGYNPPKQYAPVKTGLELLLEHYGVKVKNSYVFDDYAYEQADRNYGDLKLYFVPEIQSENLNRKLPYMKDLKGLLTIQSAPLELVDDALKANNAKATVLFSSSKKSWEISEGISLDPLQPPRPVADSEKKSYPLAYMIEGDFTSYYKGKTLPERPKKEVEKEITSGIASKDVSIKEDYIEQGKKGKIFVVGTSEIAKDVILGGIPANQMLVQNVIDYLNGREDYAIMRSKVQLVNPLDASKVTPVAKEITRYFNIIGLPIFIALAGIFIFFRRQGRKNQIQAMFMKKQTEKKE